MRSRFSPASIFLYIIIVAIVYMLVRPGSQAAEAMIAVAAAFAALISAAEGQPHKPGGSSTDSTKSTGSIM